MNIIVNYNLGECFRYIISYEIASRITQKLICTWCEVMINVVLLYRFFIPNIWNYFSLKKVGWKRLLARNSPQNNQVFLCILISLLKCFYICYNIWTLNINKLESPGIHIYVMFCQALGITENRLSFKIIFFIMRYFKLETAIVLCSIFMMDKKLHSSQEGLNYETLAYDVIISCIRCSYLLHTM